MDQLVVVVVVVVVVVYLVDQLVAGVLQVVVQLDTLVGTHLVCKMIEVDQIYVKMICRLGIRQCKKIQCRPIMVVF